ncbi:DUF4405 domain-containing protein [Candidatus Magnetomoraceae bacterium gMMP-1]
MKTSTIRSITKTGMTISLAGLVLSGIGINGSKGCRCQSSTLHTWSGVALVGFSVWHYNTYQKSPKQTKSKKLKMKN